MRTTLLIFALAIAAIGCTKEPEEKCWNCITAMNDSIVGFAQFVGTGDDATRYEYENSYTWTRTSKETGITETWKTTTECQSIN